MPVICVDLALVSWMVVVAGSCSYIIHVVIVTVLVWNITLVNEERYGIGSFPLECCYSWQTMRDDGLFNKERLRNCSYSYSYCSTAKAI
jgi:hypothetical protein